MSPGGARSKSQSEGAVTSRVGGGAGFCANREGRGAGERRGVRARALCAGGRPRLSRSLARRAVGGVVGGAAAAAAAGKHGGGAAGSVRCSAMAVSPVEVFGLPSEEVRPATALFLPASAPRFPLPFSAEGGRAAASPPGRAGPGWAGRFSSQGGGFLRARSGLAWRPGGGAGLR